MQGLEYILKEMKEIKDRNREEKLYAKYPPHSEDQRALNAYSRGYEDGTDNFYNALMYIIRKHMSGKGSNVHTNDGWIPVERRLPEEGNPVLIQWERYDKYLDDTLRFMDVMWLHNADEKIFRSINRTTRVDIVAWRPLPEPYRSEQTTAGGHHD